MRGLISVRTQKKLKDAIVNLDELPHTPAVDESVAADEKAAKISN